MKRDDYLKLVGEVRDLQILDASGRRCGIADDIEFEGGVGAPLKLAAVLVGPGAYRRRLPNWAFAVIRWMVGDRFTRIPWNEVLRITAVIELEKNAETYGLRHIENALERYLSEIPGARS